MSITSEKKQELIKEYRRSDLDTGSTEVQCAILTERINNLTQHLRTHKKDFGSKRGLIILVNSRKKLLKYIKERDNQVYMDLIKRLELRK